MKRVIIAIGLFTASLATAQDFTGIWVGGTTALGNPIFVQAELAGDGTTLHGTLEVPAQDVVIKMEKVQSKDRILAFDLPTPYGTFHVEGAMDGGLLRARVRTPDGRDATMHLLRSGPAPAKISSFAGTYLMANGETVIVTPRTNGQLRLIGTTSLNSMRLVPMGGNRFLDAASIVKDPAAARELEFPPGKAVALIDQEAVTFRNGPLELAGTLFTPHTPGLHAAAVVVHGSGAVTRDVLLQRAQLLMRMNLAVLLYDKRGTGESDGDWRNASFEDLAGDALAALAYLRTRADIDTARIGIVGHSQAGWIIPIATSKDPGIAFAIIASGGGVTPEEQEIFRAEATTKNAAAKELATLTWRYARTGEGWEAYEKAWQASTREAWFGDVAVARTKDDPLWRQVRTFAAYDPLPYLASSKTPTLVILAVEDHTLPAARAAEIWRKKTSADVVMIRDAGHNLMRKQKDGTYVYAPEYVDAMRAWLQKRGIKTTTLF